MLLSFQYVLLRIKHKENCHEINSNSDIKQGSVSCAELSSSSSLSERPLWQHEGAPSPAHTVPPAPKLMHHLWIAVISIWWMFSEWSRPHGPQTEALVAGSSTQRRLCLLSWRSVIFLFSSSPEPKSRIPQLLPVHSSCLLPCCVQMYMYARLLTWVSHRSPRRCRLPSWGNAWVPPVNFTAFIWPDEWLAALSVPLPAISSGSLEPPTASRLSRPLQHTLYLLYIHSTRSQSTQRRRITFR